MTDTIAVMPPVQRAPIGTAVGPGAYDVAVTIALFTIAMRQFLSPSKSETDKGDESEKAGAGSRLTRRLMTR